MKKSIELLEVGFESSSEKTQEFTNFLKTFKKEFTAELKAVGAESIKIEKGHFCISGFFTVNGKAFYFSISDVRWIGKEPNMLYRTARDYKDFTGGSNQYVTIKSGMAKEMNL